MSKPIKEAVPPRSPNRLQSETSPYLRQHMHNPVDWLPWGREAFALATESDRPILSIPMLGTLIHSPTAAILYQLREVVLGREVGPADRRQVLHECVGHGGAQLLFEAEIHLVPGAFVDGHGSPLCRRHGQGK